MYKQLRREVYPEQEEKKNSLFLIKPFIAPNKIGYSLIL